MRQVLIVGLATSVVVLGLTVARLGAWFATVDERMIVALHLTRFVGVYILVLRAGGSSPIRSRCLVGGATSP